MNIPIKIIQNAQFFPPTTKSFHQNMAKRLMKKQEKSQGNSDKIAPLKLPQTSHHKKHNNPKNKVFKWFFSLDTADKIKVCSIQNKWLIRILYQMYIINVYEPNIKFIPTNQYEGFNKDNSCEFQINQFERTFSEKSPPLDKYTTFFSPFPREKEKRISIDDSYCSSYYFQKHREESQNERELLNEIRFLSINDLNDTITFSIDLLNNEQSFINNFDLFSSQKCFTEQIMAFYDSSNKLYNYRMPEWIELSNKFSLGEIFIIFFEQSISINYQLYNNEDKIQSFANNEKINDILDMNRKIETFLTEESAGNKKQFFDTLDFNKITREIREPSTKYIIQTYSNDAKWVFNNYYGSNEWSGDKLGIHLIDESERKLNSIFNSFIPKFVDTITFIEIKIAFKVDNFVYLMVYKQISELLRAKIENDLIKEDELSIGNQKSKRKKNKKKKKKDGNEENIKDKKDDNKNITPVKNIILENQPLDNKQINSDVDVNENCNVKENQSEIKKEKKKKKKEKEKGFFLYPSYKISNQHQQKEKQQKNEEKITLPNINNNNNNQSKEEQISNQLKDNTKNDYSPKSNLLSSSSQTNTSTQNLDLTEENSCTINLTPPKSKNPQSSQPATIHVNNYYFNDNKLFPGFYSHFPNQLPRPFYPQYPFRMPYLCLGLYNPISSFSHSEQYQNEFNEISKEIEDYYNEVQSNLDSIKPFRQKEIDNLLNEINLCLSKEYDIEIAFYGSYASGLSIESSDVDILIKFKEIQIDNSNYNNNKLNYQYSTFYCNSKIEKIINLLVNYFKSSKKKNFDYVYPIYTASVPVLKIQIDLSKEISDEVRENLEKNYKFDYNKDIKKIKFDLTFIEISTETSLQHNKIPAEEMVDYIKNMLKCFPEIKPIITVIKRYMQLMQLNSSFSGGISSFSIFLLILAYLKSTKLFHNNPPQSLGRILFEFFECYSNLNFKIYCIDIKAPNPFILLNDLHESGMLILDPLTSYNAARSSSRIDEIKSTFSKAVQIISKSVLYNNSTQKSYKSGILNEMFDVKKEFYM